MGPNRAASRDLHLKVPPPETALFQHSPSPGARVKTEWEPGCQPDEVYDRVLPPWRSRLRRYLVDRLRKEKDWMAGWQGRVRTKERDRYFYWTAVFGTHTFFMTFLPMFFFFGYPYKGRGMLHVVGLGIYISSFAKDLVCTPRPYSPPVVRLSMSTHHHEYGFPSSHSTNSVSIALFLGEWLFEYREKIGVPILLAAWAVLIVYAASVVGGRLYTGMHSVADIVGGSIMGVGCWGLWLLVGTHVEAWVATGSYSVPLITVPVALSLVHYHPEPVDDCPCFEDAIAILAVILGGFVGHWADVRLGMSVPPNLRRGIWDEGAAMGTLITCLRIVIGIGIIFAWRLLAKATLLRVLPPIFRFTAKLFDFDLPTRRFYKAATAYPGVPDTPIRAIPSFIDLATENTSSDNTPDGSSSPSESAHSHSPHMLSVNGSHDVVRSRSPSPLRMRTRTGNGVEPGVRQLDKQMEMNKSVVVQSKRRREKDPAKYDAEVLTKVGVYSGIGLLATTMVPILFGLIEKALFGR
ncbi:hypothetical protein EHS25_000411 [Saitozyma podzolica]|uniref:Phosphatidic acid phosphatase type 2/haloperoxidase domain-containing protein n=1 Tax=Saitozyma podzolica TaxID=1890683 RepID=A0A427YW13_9TREE|nr:hypothetical protein EHS25_000411 [Saitozyma podzolica]